MASRNDQERKRDRSFMVRITSRVEALAPHRETRTKDRYSLQDTMTTTVFAFDVVASRYIGGSEVKRRSNRSRKWRVQTSNTGQALAT